MSRDSEAPRDEPQPLTKEEREAIAASAQNAVMMFGQREVGRMTFEFLLRYEATVQRLEAENARLRKATDGISDYGWSYDGRTTFTVNCTDRTAAATLMTAIEESKTRDSDLWNRREILSPSP